MPRDPNRPEPGASRPTDGDGPRDYNPESGSAPQDGYTVLKRRPRLRHMTESIDPKRAAELERMHRRFNGPRGY